MKQKVKKAPYIKEFDDAICEHDIVIEKID